MIFGNLVNSLFSYKCHFISYGSERVNTLNLNLQILSDLDVSIDQQEHQSTIGFDGNSCTGWETF